MEKRAVLKLTDPRFTDGCNVQADEELWGRKTPPVIHTIKPTGHSRGLPCRLLETEAWS